MRMMKKNKNSKSAFSIAYAIVGLVVVGVAIAGLTPVLTRKLPNLSTSSMIKNPKGWYESYNAAPEGAPYCAECEDADKHNRSWPDNPNYNSGKITGKKVGDPEYNKYVKPSNLVPFERYCKSSNNCGYPKDKWNEGETHNEKHPHNCAKNADGKCHFKPAPGVTKFEIFAIGGGGGSGSAVAEKPSSVRTDGNTTYNDLVVGKSTTSPPMGANNATDKTNFVQADFIDKNYNNMSSVGSGGNLVDKVEANIAGKKSATGIFYTAKDTAVSSSKTGKTYPTEAKNATLASFASEQIKRLYKENKKTTDANDMTGRYYFYTKDLGVYKYNQNSIYTLMPEWLKVYGDEYRYPCTTNDLTSCPNDMNSCKNDKCSGQNQVPNTKITKDYSQVAAVACSGNGGSGANVFVSQKVVCSWMKPSTCEYNNLVKTKVAQHQLKDDTCSLSGCGSTSAPSSNDGLGSVNNEYCASKLGMQTDEHIEKDENGNSYYQCDSKYCNYGDLYYNRKCTYKEFVGQYVSCTCPDYILPPRCHDNQDVETECKTDSIELKLDPNSAGDMNRLYGLLEQNQKDDIHSSIDYIVDGVKTSQAGGYDAKGLMQNIRLNNQIKQAHNEELSLSYSLKTGRGTPDCHATHPYSRAAYGGIYGDGICAYRNEAISKGESYSVRTSIPPMSANMSKAKTRTECGRGDNGADAADVFACIKKSNKPEKCRTASGGKGGEGGFIGDLCSGSASNGANGSDGSVTGSGNGGSFPLMEKSNTGNEDKDKISSYLGTRKYPGIYNYRYVWYMPFVTKHLMFGTAGETGEEVHTMVSLSEGQELIVVPGRGAKKTDYRTGANGQNGSDSTVKNANNQDGKTKVDITAHGGKGGIGSQKTDEYLLCHIADKQGNKNLPCYEKPKNTDNIEALKQKENTFQNSVRMSESLKKGNPGIGARGLGTESVSDFVCEERYVEKWDKINNVDTRATLQRNGKTTTKVITAGGTLKDACKGNSKIRYILPNSEQYATGTGAVIILW